MAEGYNRAKALANFPIQTGNVRQSKGSTTATAHAKLSREPEGSGLLSIWLEVDKNGLNGKGYGYVAASLYDAPGNTLDSFNDISVNVGADVESGHAYHSTSQNITITAAHIAVVKTVAIAVAAADDNGLPHSIEQATKVLKKIGSLLAAGVSVGNAIEGWVVLVAD